jgi:hypothetical protein
MGCKPWIADEADGGRVSWIMKIVHPVSGVDEPEVTYGERCWGSGTVAVQPSIHVIVRANASGVNVCSAEGSNRRSTTDAPA